MIRTRKMLLNLISTSVSPLNFSLDVRFSAIACNSSLFFKLFLLPQTAFILTNDNYLRTYKYNIYSTWATLLEGLILQYFLKCKIIIGTYFCFLLLFPFNYSFLFAKRLRLLTYLNILSLVDNSVLNNYITYICL